MLLAEICLYGNMEVGAGWLVRTHDGKMAGTGEPRQTADGPESFTVAVYKACLWLRDNGYKSGDVRIFAPGGRKMAEMPVQSFRYYGAIKWKAAPVLEISAEDIERASVA
jgi:hypothetical protein